MIQQTWVRDSDFILPPGNGCRHHPHHSFPTIRETVRQSGAITGQKPPSSCLPGLCISSSPLPHCGSSPVIKADPFILVQVADSSSSSMSFAWENERHNPGTPPGAVWVGTGRGLTDAGQTPVAPAQKDAALKSFYAETPVRPSRAGAKIRGPQLSFCRKPRKNLLWKRW